MSDADKGNKGRDRFVSDITARVKNNSEANKSNIILIRYIKKDKKPDFDKDNKSEAPKRINDSRIKQNKKFVEIIKKVVWCI